MKRKTLLLFNFVLVLMVVFSSISFAFTSVPVKGISLNQAGVTLAIGKTVTLTASISPANATNKAVSWSSSDKNIAKVNAKGVVTALKVGKATITVKSADGKVNAKCIVTVVKTVQEIKPYVWKPDPANLEWKKDTSPVKLKVFFNYSSATPFEWGTTDVTKEVTKRTGVTIEGTFSPDNESQKLNLMLASGEKLPDFIIGIQPPSKLFTNIVKDGTIWSITDLVDKYAPNMREVMLKGNEEFAAQDDGKLYHLGITMKGYDQLSDSRLVDPPKYAVRNDIWEELGKPEIKTPDDIIRVAKLAKAKYPDLKFPVFLSMDNCPVPFANTFGLASSSLCNYVYDYKNDKYLHWVEATKGKSALKFMNRMYREGVLTPETFTVKDYRQELDKGSIFLYATPNIFATYTSNAKLTKIKDNMYYHFIAPPVQPGEKFESLMNFTATTWRGVVVTKDSQYPDRAIKYLEFMISDEGQQLFLCGINGVHHDMVQSDKGWWYPLFKPEIAKLVSSDFGKLSSQYGIYGWDRYIWLIYNIPDYTFTYASGLSPENKLMKDGNDLYSSLKVVNRIDGVVNCVSFSGDSDENVIVKKINDYLLNKLAKVITAKNDAAFENEYGSMLQGLKTAGIDKVRDAYAVECKKYMNMAKKAGIQLTTP